jgi:hypothetical protein
MSNQSTALNVADALFSGKTTSAHICLAITELLRQHALIEEMRDVLKSLDTRLRKCSSNSSISAADAYDSFYQEIVADALAKAEGVQA